MDFLQSASNLHRFSGLAQDGVAAQAGHYRVLTSAADGVSLAQSRRPVVCPAYRNLCARCCGAKSVPGDRLTFNSCLRGLVPIRRVLRSGPPDTVEPHSLPG